MACESKYLVSFRTAMAETLRCLEELDEWYTGLLCGQCSETLLEW